MMKVYEQFPQIARSEIFNDLPRPFVRDFLDRCTVRHIRKRTHILTEGGYADGVWIVAHGKVDVYNTSFNGQRVLLHRAGEGEILGELETMADRVCVASCETTGAAILLFCPGSLLFEAVRTHIFLRNLQQVLYGKMLRSSRFKVVDSCYPIGQRLCAYLNYLAGNGSVITESQSFLAELIGCSRQTINRELKVLRDDGVIATHNSRIEIADAARLRTLAGVIDP